MKRIVKLLVVLCTILSIGLNSKVQQAYADDNELETKTYDVTLYSIDHEDSEDPNKLLPAGYNYEYTLPEVFAEGYYLNFDGYYNCYQSEGKLYARGSSNYYYDYVNNKYILYYTSEDMDVTATANVKDVHYVFNIHIISYNNECIRKEADKIIAAATKDGESEVDKIKAVTEYINKNYSYDENGSYKAYELINGSGNEEAFSNLLKVVFDRLGFTSSVISNSWYSGGVYNEKEVSVQLTDKMIYLCNASENVVTEIGAHGFATKYNEETGISLVRYVGFDKEIKVPAIVDGKEVYSVNSGCFHNTNVNIEGIEFETGISYICLESYLMYNPLKGIILPENIADIESISIDDSTILYVRSQQAFDGYVDMLSKDEYTIEYIDRLRILKDSTITFNPNNGVGEEYTVSSEDSRITLPENTFTRKGYIFEGWAYEKDAEAATFTSGETYYCEGDVTLYAKWRPIKYKLELMVYDKYEGWWGGEYYDVMEQDIDCTYDESYELPVTKREHYTLLGYSYNENATSADYLATDVVFNLTDKDDDIVRLYQIWKPDEYKYTFNTNGGKGGPGSLNKKHDIELEIPATEPTKTGYKFLGWSKDKNGTRVEYKPINKLDFEEATTLYAVWRKAYYYIYYSIDGNTSIIDGAQKYYNSDYKLAEIIPVKKGYTFAGWSKTKDAKKADYRPGAIYSKNENITFYAVWKKAGVKIASKTSSQFNSGLNLFAGKKYLNREDMISFLWNADGKTVSDAKISFKDVNKNSPSYNAIAWAKSSKISSGLNANTFGMGKGLTRQDFIKLLYEYAIYKDIDVSVMSDKALKDKTDAKAVSGYAADAMNWAFENNLIGVNSKLNPKKVIRSKDATTIITRFMNIVTE